jgi:apoptosis-inducing factor 2
MKSDHPMQNRHQRKVVVYGGGVARALLAKKLARDVEVTLVDPLDYFEVPMAAPRCLLRLR